ncbi:g1 s-specific cyclin-d1 [Limosa lapponica baueri]|uniref:G1 s-specific cyclin-d1 n=1 Tax=Limosa lapponica baueri TaxID=1758121 RepID=A0A2I0TW46_LIMLA|nr:g1 s-specific cyclin-d1 [Limosa lapponica baueri]
MEHQLLCCEVETIRRAYLDANLLNDRVLQTMLKAEETCSPSVSYFKCVQKEILPYMRKIVATWMLEQMELLLVNKLKWNLAAMTPHDFIEHFLTKMPLAEDTKQIIRKHAQTFVALCATDIKFISNPPSMIAAGSVVAAVQGLHLGNTNTFLSYQCLTHFLSQVIKCDPYLTLESDHVYCVCERFCLDLVVDLLAETTNTTALMVCPEDHDCLRACQEQIESLLESSLRQAQQHNVSSETKTVEDEADLSCTPTDVRDVNI